MRKIVGALITILGLCLFVVAVSADETNRERSW